MCYCIMVSRSVILSNSLKGLVAQYFYNKPKWQVTINHLDSSVASFFFFFLSIINNLLLRLCCKNIVPTASFFLPIEIIHLCPMPPPANQIICLPVLTSLVSWLKKWKSTCKKNNVIMWQLKKLQTHLPI